MRAAQWAAREAKMRGRGVTLVHSVLPTMAGGAFGVGLPPRLDLIDEMRIAAITELTRIAADLDCVDVQVHVEVSTASGLLLMASDTAEMIVLGSRGRGGFTGLLLGSVGIQVTSHASCPVIVMRAESRTDANDIVVGIDGSPHSVAALQFAFDEASRHGWNLIAVHAWDVPSYDLILVPDGPIPIPMEHVADDEIRLTAEVLAGFIEDYPDVHVTERLVRSPAVQALLDNATDAALIVVGTRGRNAAVGALLGSVSNGILHKAKTPVAVIPLPPEQPDAA
jgi:nucleotide-binding universal stress UspA family protein